MKKLERNGHSLISGIASYPYSYWAAFLRLLTIIIRFRSFNAGWIWSVYSLLELILMAIFFALKSFIARQKERLLGNKLSDEKV